MEDVESQEPRTEVSSEKVPANEASAIDSLRILHTACVAYKVEHGSYPEHLSDLDLDDGFVPGGRFNLEKAGYGFSYSLRSEYTATGTHWDTDGPTNKYTLQAIPVPFILANHPTIFLTDQTGIIQSCTSEATCAQAHATLARANRGFFVVDPRLQRVVSKLQQSQLRMPEGIRFLIGTAPRTVNGHAFRGTNTITIDSGSLTLPEAELAFLVAHEIGHLQDQTAACDNVEGHSKHECEDNADWIGQQYLVAAGYDGYAGAALFGRFMMMGGRASFAGQLAITLFDSHRSELGRTNNLLASWRSYCQKFGCR